MSDLTFRLAACGIAAFTFMLALDGRAAAFEIWPGDPLYPAARQDPRARPPRPVLAKARHRVGSRRPEKVAAQKPASEPTAEGSRSGASGNGKGEPVKTAHKASGKADSGPPRKVYTSSSTDGRTCVRSRRKLWQGEVWVVKNVTVCP